MPEVEVKSNMLGYIENIKRGVMFQDAGTVLDELVQNAQRSKAEVIEVDINGDTLSVTDNGTGCADPQMLFESNASGWDDQPEAFGEGFFSIFYLGSQVSIRSLDWELDLDIDNLVDTGNLVVDDIRKSNSYLNGFSIDVTGEMVRECRYELSERAEELGSLSDCTFLLNGEEVDHTDIFATGNPNAVHVENDIFEAVIEPSVYDNMEYYYENRRVDSSYVYAVKGALAFKKGGITLKAPDRKSIVCDDKKDVFSSTLSEAIGDMYRSFIKTATDMQIDTFSMGIEHYLGVSEYAPLLPVTDELIRNGDYDGSYDDLSGAGEAISIAISDILNSIAKEQGDTRSKNALKAVVDAANGMVAYVDTCEVKRMQNRIAQAEYDGIAILYAPNSLYRKAFEYYGVPKLSNIEDFISKVPVIENADVQDAKEARFMEFMAMVELRFGFEPGTISIADVGMDTLDKSGQVLDSKRSCVRGVTGNGKIFIDRTALGLRDYKLPEPGNSITNEDWRMLMASSCIICHEIAHMLYGTHDATTDHESAIDEVTHEYASIF